MTDDKPNENKEVKKARISVDDLTFPKVIQEARLSYDHIEAGSEKIGVGTDQRISASEISNQAQPKKTDEKQKSQ